MKPASLESTEQILRESARQYSYPPTPEISNEVLGRLERRGGNRSGNRRWTWALVLILIASAALLSVSPVRAALVEFLQFGAIRIWLQGPQLTPTAAPAGTAVAPALSAPSTATQAPSLTNLEGETTLEAAQSGAGFEILLPGYPGDLGPPDQVFLQDFGSPAVIMLWLDPDDPGRISLSLMAFAPGSFVHKYEPPVLDQAMVDGNPALWMQGTHMLRVKSGDLQVVDMVVNGNVLAWEEGEITYRLETDLPLEEAIRIAESLH